MPVSDEVQDVDTFAESRLEGLESARIGRAKGFNATVAGYCFLQELPLIVAVDRRQAVIFQVCGIGDRHQDADRPLQNGAPRNPLAGEVAREWGCFHCREGLRGRTIAAILQQFPWQRVQLWRRAVTAEPNPAQRMLSAHLGPGSL